MLFNSFQFLVFFIVVTVAVFAAPVRARWVLLLAASYWFYLSWNPRYLVLILFTTLTSFGCALLLERVRNARLRKILLAIGILVQLSVLFAFKYANFAFGTVNDVAEAVGSRAGLPMLDVILPVGISFYTFQALSYTIDVYYRRMPAERHLGIYSLYVSFFPQLVAGPIERAQNLLPQFRKPTRIEAVRWREGFELILWGLFKKVVIADLLATVVDHVYSHPQQFPGPVLIVATLFFAVQIYCDFSGYSDIAIGTARILGYDLMANFRTPYFADSLADFWRRWHISLSSWFRDYVYRPLGGNRVPPLRWAINILAVFVLSGLWHGANWTFVVWGALHGSLLMLEAATTAFRGKAAFALGMHRVPALHRILKTSLIFGVVLVTWVFFRASTLSDAIYVLANVANVGDFRTADLWVLGLPRFEMILAFAMIATLFAVELAISQQWNIAEGIWNRAPARRLCYCMCFYAIVFFGVFDNVQFIYFQF